MRLYALCDADTLRVRGVSVEAFAEKAERLGAQILQYRNKHDDIETVRRDLTMLRRLWKGTLIINDRYSLLPLCDGVHIGQEDLYAIDPDPVRAVALLRASAVSETIIGLSTHNAREIGIANALDLDYVGLGAYRATSTKSDAKVLGESLDAIAALSHHPVAAIGGVRLDDSFSHVTYHVIGSGLL